jgi:hypothetical protein
MAHTLTPPVYSCDGLLCSKILYLKTELLADLGLQNWRSTEFWVTLTIFTIMFWLRMYIHYIGQYLYLWVSPGGIRKGRCR